MAIPDEILLTRTRHICRECRGYFARLMETPGTVFDDVVKAGIIIS
ncbi:MAG: hypothetical protein LBU69_06675 [Deltaproteobacteria bacterium]|nr:hypothetical protein [Deltaproteobacteria bacterium]